MGKMHPVVTPLKLKKAFKGKLLLKPKLSMFCVLSQNYQHCFFFKVKNSGAIEKLKMTVEF